MEREVMVKVMDFEMTYRKCQGEDECEGVVHNAFGIVLTQKWNDGRVNELQINNISTKEDRVDRLLNMMENGIVTPMTAYEIVEDFLEI